MYWSIQPGLELDAIFVTNLVSLALAYFDHVNLAIPDKVAELVKDHMPAGDLGGERQHIFFVSLRDDLK